MYKKMPARSSMMRAGVRSTAADRDFAGCSLLGDIMKRTDFCRPGLCRLFPLGRYYEENGFKYFIQIHECSRKDRGKVKIKKWLGIPNLKAYESYIMEWHDFLNECESAMESLSDDNTRILTLYVLRIFYETSYMAQDENAFYEEFRARMTGVREKLGMESR